MALLEHLDGTKQIRLKDYAPDDHRGIKKTEADKIEPKLLAELAELQTLLYAAQETPVLIVLQGLDTAGKDGTIRHVMSAISPQSCRVATFKTPTATELAHDFLWRTHAEAPARGAVAIFNRSHYEDVLVVRVHDLVPPEVWQRRYEMINSFERLLADNNTIILKFFLHISKQEQKKRLLARETDPLKAWKISDSDWKERDYWDDYQSAYEVVLNRCSAPHAPWYVVPADRKWFRDYAIAHTIVETLRPMREIWTNRLKERGKEELKVVGAEREHHASPS